MEVWKNRITAVMILFLLFIAGFFTKHYLSGNFNSVKSLQEYIGTFGLYGPIVLTGFQFLQVIIPVLPGMVGCAVGSILFGTAWGFWCNYIGICVGSLAAYYLARKFGIDIVLMMFPQKTYDKWSRIFKKSRYFAAFLFVATLLPLFPDDFLCYFSGLVRMNWRKFVWIILLGKPWCILAYCIGFGLIK